ncbi:MAG TPA: ATP synthase F1 subunit gamma [Candidatus Acidoferrales bacterium]|jgi:F-type H+-transporting ATPase subunit gamma|nr:ATP synthase F1 subunit gamma [Candidatus Acidoferrales bacterium]
MPTLVDFRRRIRSVKNTQQITRAMKFVAAARLRRSQEGVFAARPYAREILRVLRSAVARMEEPVHPLLERRPEERLLVLVLTGDRGLCGAFNSNVLKRAAEFFREHAAQKLDVIAIGKKGRDALRKKRAHLVGEYLNVTVSVEFREAKEIAGRIAELYAKREVDAVYAVYNEFKSVLVQRLCAERLLPIASEVVTGKPQTAAETGHAAGLPVDPGARGTELLVDYIYEQPAEQIFRGLVPRYLEAEIFRILLESSAAEHGARMAAMDSATNNAADLIEQVTLQMNKIRQAGITKELIEIVSGAASASS